MPFMVVVGSKGAIASEASSFRGVSRQPEYRAGDSAVAATGTDVALLHERRARAATVRDTRAAWRARARQVVTSVTPASTPRVAQGRPSRTRTTLILAPTAIVALVTAMEIAPKMIAVPA